MSVSNLPFGYRKQGDTLGYRPVITIVEFSAVAPPHRCSFATPREDAGAAFGGVGFVAELSEWEVMVGGPAIGVIAFEWLLE